MYTIRETLWASFSFRLSVSFCSVHFKMTSMHWETPIRAPHRLLEVSTICCLSNSFNVSLTDDVSLSSFQGISSSASSFHPSLLQAIDGVMSLALCPQVVAEAPQHVRSSETQSICVVALPASISVWSFPFTPACSGQCTHINFRTWMSNTDTCQSGLPVPFCSTYCAISKEDNDALGETLIYLSAFLVK